MLRDDTVYLAHIRDALRQIATYTAGMNEDSFRENRLVQDGVIRQFEVIGEATKNLSASFKEQHPAIPWKDLAGFRDKLIHHYFGVDISLVWRSVQDDLPLLNDALANIVTS